MALSDPKVVTINAIPFDLFRISVGENRSVYAVDDGVANLRLTVSHQYGKRKRSLIRLDNTKTVVDALLPQQNRLVSQSFSVVIDRPLTGFSAVDTKLGLEALIGVLTASSGADTAKIIGGQN